MFNITSTIITSPEECIFLLLGDYFVLRHNFCSIKLHYIPCRHIFWRLALRPLPSLWLSHCLWMVPLTTTTWRYAHNSVPLLWWRLYQLLWAISGPCINIVPSVIDQTIFCERVRRYSDMRYQGFSGFQVRSGDCLLSAAVYYPYQPSCASPDSRPRLRFSSVTCHGMFQCLASPVAPLHNYGSTTILYYLQLDTSTCHPVSLNDTVVYSYNLLVTSWFWGLFLGSLMIKCFHH